MIASSALLLGGIRCHSYYQFAANNEMIYNGSSSKNDTFKVAFIGDSWAAYHVANDTYLQSFLSDFGEPVLVKSKGNVGAKSKEIYERLFTTTKPLLEWHPDYCVISAGINDAVAKIGKDYYVHHYMLILQQLVDMGIKPVVLEMPEVNYRAIASREPWTMRMRHLLSSLVTDSELDGFVSYKTALMSAIRMAGLQSCIVYVSANSWNTDGFRDVRNLYLSDETHLNARGYEVLDSCISSEILKDIWKKQ